MTLPSRSLENVPVTKSIPFDWWIYGNSLFRKFLKNRASKFVKNQYIFWVIQKIFLIYHSYWSKFLADIWDGSLTFLRTSQNWWKAIIYLFTFSVSVILKLDFYYISWKKDEHITIGEWMGLTDLLTTDNPFFMIPVHNALQVECQNLPKLNLSKTFQHGQWWTMVVVEIELMPEDSLWKLFFQKNDDLPLLTAKI